MEKKTALRRNLVGYLMQALRDGPTSMVVAYQIDEKLNATLWYSVNYKLIRAIKSGIIGI
jgi:hypothetical protein